MRYTKCIGHFCSVCGHKWMYTVDILWCGNRSKDCPNCAAHDYREGLPKPWKYDDSNDFDAWVLNVRMGVYAES